MKKILLIALLFLSTSYAQYSVLNYDPSYDNDWRSEWKIDKILNVGDEKCLHQWVKESVKIYSMTSCAVFHDNRGCPNNWGKEEWICKLCLRDIFTSEDRIIIPQKEKPQSEFELLKEKLKKIR